MAPITVDQFRRTLTAAAAQRGRDYTHVYSVTVRWENDDTNAAQDAERFQRMLKNLDVTPAIEHIIRHNDPSPARTFQKALLDFIESFRAKSDAEHNLTIFHYAGHGMTKNGSFTFAETKEAKRTLNADNCLLSNLKDADIIPESDHLDVLVILDCCFAHIATRTPTIPRRVVEVIAATSVQTPRQDPRRTIH